MRKTVHEWLETHGRGRQMGKKQRKIAAPVKTEVEPMAKKKKVAKKTVRKKGKRKPR